MYFHPHQVNQQSVCTVEEISVNIHFSNRLIGTTAFPEIKTWTLFQPSVRVATVHTKLQSEMIYIATVYLHMTLYTLTVMYMHLYM